MNWWNGLWGHGVNSPALDKVQWWALVSTGSHRNWGISWGPNFIKVSQLSNIDICNWIRCWVDRLAWLTGRVLLAWTVIVNAWKFNFILDWMLILQCMRYFILLVAAQGIGVSWRPGDSSILCLWEEWEHGSQFFTISESWRLKGSFDFIYHTTHIVTYSQRTESEKWTAEGTPWIQFPPYSQWMKKFLKQLDCLGLRNY